MPGGCAGRPPGRRPGRPATRTGPSQLRRTAQWSRTVGRRRRRAGSTGPASERRPRPARRLR
eukprot:4217282-Alexandrium_andersonii.AAC.1